MLIVAIRRRLLTGGISMRINPILMRHIGFVLMATASLTAGSWDLPQGTPVKDNGPRTYRFSGDYTTLSTKGDIVHRRREAREYTRALPGGDVVWVNVTVAVAGGVSGPLAATQKSEIMEGVRYLEAPAWFTGYT